MAASQTVGTSDPISELEPFDLSAAIPEAIEVSEEWDPPEGEKKGKKGD